MLRIKKLDIQGGNRVMWESHQMCKGSMKQIRSSRRVGTRVFPRQLTQQANAIERWQ